MQMGWTLDIVVQENICVRHSSGDLASLMTSSQPNQDGRAGYIIKQEKHDREGAHFIATTNLAIQKQISPGGN